MEHNRSFSQISVGKKMILAITGFILFGFILVHLAGNLQIFQGPEKINAYAKMLKDLGPLTWVARIILLISFIVHVGLAIRLTIENRKARPIAYHKQDTLVADYASRTMIYSGMMLFILILYHLAHLTFHVTDSEIAMLTDSKQRADVYNMIVLSFSKAHIAGLYLFFTALLSLHLYHGLFSFLQTFGINRPQLQDKFRLLTRGIAILIFLGNASIPISVLFNILTLNQGGL